MIAVSCARVVLVTLILFLAWPSSDVTLGARLQTDSNPNQFLRVGWSAPLKLSGETAGWFPDVAADPFGNVHVVWNGGFADTILWAKQSALRGYSVDAPPSDVPIRNTHRVEALYYVKRDAHGWTEPNDIALISYASALRSSITADQAGRVHLTHNGVGTLAPEQFGSGNFLGSRGIWYTAFDADSPLSAQSLQPPKRISRYHYGYFSDIAVDSHGVIHAIWTESVAGSWSIYYAHSADQGETWSDRVALEERGGRAQLRIDTRDRLHVVWELFDPNALPSQIAGASYSLSSDGGSTWSRIRFPDDQQPAIGIDGQGKVLLVFREPRTDRILYRASNDGASWSGAAAIPGIGLGLPRPHDVYDMATDNAGNVHLVVVANRSATGSMALLHLEWDGRQWGPPSVIAGSPHFPEYPRLAIGEGNRLHVVWFDGDRASIDREATGIWYSTAQSSATPVATAAPRTRESAVPTAVARPVLSSAPASPGAPVSRGAGNEPDASSPERSFAENRPEIAVILGLTPVVLLLTGIFIAAVRPGPLRHLILGRGRRTRRV
jgi:hypothetical protein